MNEELEYSDVGILEEQENIEMIETVEVIEVSDVPTYEIDSAEAFPALGTSNDGLRHSLLNGKELPDQHPITAITGLDERLDEIERIKTVYSDKVNIANYYEWNDSKYDEYGYFVSLVPNTSAIKICDGSDILGVSVNAAGFIGGQYGDAPDDSYGLIVTSGLVDVRCELDVNVGDYVVSNTNGYAEKTDSEYGYKVLAKENKNGVDYALILLGVQADIINDLGIDLNQVKVRVSDNEKNIAAAMNVANEAYKKSSRVGEISKEAIKNALDALNKSNETSQKTDDIERNLSLVNEVATQARAISEASVTSAEKIRSEAVATANNALSTAYNTQNDLTKLSDEMAPLTQWEGENRSGIVGFVARANADSATLASLAEWKEGESENQSIAGAIAKVNEHEAVLDHITSHQGINGSTIAQVEQKADDNNASIISLVSSVDKYSVGEYSQAYGLTREQAKNILKPGYIYIPTEHEDSLSHSEIFVDETEPQWFTPGDYYVWGTNEQGNADWIEHSIGSVWVSPAIPANSNGTLKYWYIDSNTPSEGYEAYALYVWEEEQWKKVNTLAGNASNRAVSMIRQTTNEIAAEVTNARGNYTGLKARLEADKDAQVEMIASVVGEDGKVTAASIVNAVNDSGSSVAINADHIVLNGYTTNGDGSFQIHQNGYMIATGGTIGGWEIDNHKIHSPAVYGSASGTICGTGMASRDADQTKPAFYAGFSGNQYTPWGHEVWYGVCISVLDASEYADVYRTATGDKRQEIINCQTPTNTDIDTMGFGTVGFAYQCYLSGNWPERTAFYVNHSGYMKASKGTLGGFYLDNGCITNIGIANVTYGTEIGISPGITTDSRDPATGKYDITMEDDATLLTDTTGKKGLCFWAGARWNGSRMELEKAPFRVYRNGKLCATDGDIGGWTINSEFFGKVDANKYGLGLWSTAVGNADETEVFAIGQINGLTNSSSWSGAEFRVTNKGKLYASGVDIEGDITASSGKFGTWSISDDNMKFPTITSDEVVENLSGTSYQVQLSARGVAIWVDGKYCFAYWHNIMGVNPFA